jgi:predicted DNA-binding transcriptional regulator YafY
MSGRNGQVARIYHILSLLENNRRGLTAEEIKHEVERSGFNVEKRTIYRDLEALSAAGIPLRESEIDVAKGTANKWIIERTAMVGNYLHLEPRELVALYLARQVLVPLRDTPFYADLQGLFTKIEGMLKEKNRDHLSELSQEIHFEPGPAWGLGVTPDTIDGVRAACNEGQFISCVYASANSQTISPRKLGPHFLYFSKGALYLVAEDAKDGKMKHFCLSRMSNVVMLDEIYEGERTNPEDYFKDSIGLFRGEGGPENVTLSFSATIAPFATGRTWHRSQQVVKKSGGVAEISLCVAVTPDMVNWILGFGPGVKVLRPKHLQEKVREAAQGIIENCEVAIEKAG